MSQLMTDNKPNRPLPLAHHFIPAVNKGMTTGHKLMVVLHGRGDTLDSYKTFTREVNVTGLNYLLLNAPFTEFFGYTWYDDSFDLSDQRYCKSLELLEEIFEILCQGNEFGGPYKSEDIFLFGFSQGGRMVLDLFLKLKKQLSGVAALSPRVTHHSNFSFNDEMKSTPLFIAHGLYDDIIPYTETEEESLLWRKNMKGSKLHSYEMGHEVDIMEIQALRNWLNEYL